MTGRMTIPRLVWGSAIVLNVVQAFGLLFLGWQSTPIIAATNNLCIAGLFAIFFVRNGK